MLDLRRLVEPEQYPPSAYMSLIQNLPIILHVSLPFIRKSWCNMLGNRKTHDLNPVAHSALSAVRPSPHLAPPHQSSPALATPYGLPIRSHRRGG